jgi:enamine deaminase RidA (YjgF/YER057c/UK114 family)
MSVVEQKIRDLGLELPDASALVVKGLTIVGAVRTGNLVFVSGSTPMKDGKFVYLGKLGAELDVKTGYEAARLAMLNSLARLKAEIGDLDRVTRIVKVLGMVNSTPEFGQQPEVMNGASDLLVEVFGDRGRHARSAVGMGALPKNISVEVELIAEFDGEAR